MRSPTTVLPLAVARQIDEICDRFESQWSSGALPRLEQYVGSLGKPAAEPLRTELLRALLSIEIGLRRRQGERPEAEKYRKRFPAYAALVTDVFRAAESRADTSVERTRSHAAAAARTPSVDRMLTNAADECQ